MLEREFRKVLIKSRASISGSRLGIAVRHSAGGLCRWAPLRIANKVREDQPQGQTHCRDLTSWAVARSVAGGREGAALQVIEYLSEEDCLKE